MASIGPSSDPLRSQAGPLPSKRGEIGYVEANGREAESRSNRPEVVLPARHPADRDTPTPVAGATAGNSTPDLSTNTLSSSSSTLVSTAGSTAKQRIIGFLKPKKVPTYGGLLLTSIVLFISQVLFAAGTIVAWVFTALIMTRRGADPSATYFIHILWGFALLCQIVFLERRIYRLRAERYNFHHPSEILPTSRNTGRRANRNIGFTPWNRPPLPTYAAALAQSGAGTGDIDDHLIAIPPPPAYGNTRGSTMLLTGHLRDSLRVQRPLSGDSQVSQRDGRPMSYVSNDERRQQTQDAERALRLHDTFSRLNFRHTGLI